MKVVDIVVLTIIIVIVGLIIYFSFWKNRKKPCNLVLCRFTSKKVVQRALLFGRIETKEEKNYGSRTK